MSNRGKQGSGVELCLVQRAWCGAPHNVRSNVRTHTWFALLRPTYLPTYYLLAYLRTYLLTYIPGPPC